MRYECVSCQYCCITTSNIVSYCGLANECIQEEFSTGLALSVCFLAIVAFGILLAGLYLGFRKRDLGVAVEPPVKI